MNDVTTYGLDLAKRVFQVHWVDVQSGEVKRKTLTRAQVSAFFAKRGAWSSRDGSLWLGTPLGSSAGRVWVTR